MIASVLASGAACRGDETPGSGNGNGPSPSPDMRGGAPVTVCPGEGVTICDLKLENSPEHPAASSPVEIKGVIVTTATLTVSKSREGDVTLAGFYAQDRTTNDALKGEYSGILVVYRPSELGASAPALNDIVDVRGTFETFAREGGDPQKQVKAVAIAKTGRGSVEAIEIRDPALIRTDAEKAKAYEGVLVKVSEVSVTNTKVKHGMMDLFGAFEVTSGLVVSNALFRFSTPNVNEAYTSIAGVLRIGNAPFDLGMSLLTPRFAQDMVAKNAASVVTSIRAIQDPTAPDRALEGCTFSGGQRMGKCAVARLSDVVVTAVGGYVSSNLRSIFVQDDRVADGRFAGVKVVYNPMQSRFIPEVGMRVDVEGEVLEYYRATQIQNATIIQHGTDRKVLEPTVVRPEDIARNSAPEMNPYEGVLVKIEDARVTAPCVADRQDIDRGSFILNDVVYVGNAFEYGYHGTRPMSVQCRNDDQQSTGLCSCEAHSRPNDQRRLGDRFSAVIGLADFSFDEFQIQPRSDADFVR